MINQFQPGDRVHYTGVYGNDVGDYTIAGHLFYDRSLYYVGVRDDGFEKDMYHTRCTRIAHEN